MLQVEDASMDLGPVMTEAESDQLLAKVSTESGLQAELIGGEPQRWSELQQWLAQRWGMCQERGEWFKLDISITHVVPLRYSCV